MSAVELLREVKRRLLAGPASKTWARHGRSYEGGPKCVMLMLGAVDGHRFAEPAFLMASFALEREAVALGYQRSDISGDCAVAVYNDTNPTRLWGVLALINRALRALEAT